MYKNIGLLNCDNIVNNIHNIVKNKSINVLVLDWQLDDYEIRCNFDVVYYQLVLSIKYSFVIFGKVLRSI